MSLGMVFYIIALVIFFLGGVGSQIVPNPIIWGLFALTLGLLLSGVTIATFRKVQ